ncbi:ATP-binding protein [Rickettsiella endosymbiont of Dermanyssus gallinae]|uniref:ATP-binding protein n=1 Tax=Rickettsiella endosymbiont of Dermanyssus gallinae TaxID=2856608 RepID=UPI001C52F59D|nr:ATP-binding protein [Rickettsiella endosymbiont of Dermanyssus gallinae]
MLTDKEQNPKTHIERITNKYVENPLSQTLANLSNTVIETALSGQSKFLFEILQNADDATCEQQPIKIEFTLKKNYLIVRHNGKGFDYNDIERICDYASQIEEVKATDLNKTGYKGLGFKALFNVSNCITLYSNGYSFRFDKTHWESPAITPWQIIPIWCEEEQLPFHESYDYQHKYVNFILKLTDVTAVKQQLKAMIQQPETLLFLRQINQLTVDIEGEKNDLQIKIEPQATFQHADFYKNKKVDSSWLLKKYDRAVPKNVKELTQEPVNNFV